MLPGLWQTEALSQEQEAKEAFTPPQSYSVERYADGWNKNPFTIKTAPVAITRVSFAENLAIGSCFGSKDDPTVIIVNTKTGERTQLKSGVASQSGMELKTVSIMPRRKDTTAEVAKGGEVAMLHFDDAYLRQVAVNHSAPAGPTAADPAISHAGPPAGAGAGSPPAKVPSPSMGGGVPPGTGAVLGNRANTGVPSSQRRMLLAVPPVPRPL